MSKILNFGSLNIDYVYTMDQIVTPGETQASLKRGVFQGGKGLNQSVACARAGAAVWHAGALGQGDCSVLTDVLEDAGVHTEFLKAHDVPPGHTVIQVDRSGQNCIILYGGANQSLRRDEIDDTLAHFGAGDVMLLQNEVNELGYLIERGFKRGLKICFNLSPFKKELLDLPLERCALLAVNEVEAAGITGLSAQSRPEDLINALASRFKDSCVVLTLGTRGSVVKPSGERAEYFGCYRVKAVDTTGSRDTYTGFLVHALASGAKVRAAMKEAACAAAISVTRPGAACSIPSRDEVLASELFNGPEPAFG